MQDAAFTGGKVALVHDFLLDLRGAERAFAAICKIWPDADIFTAVYDENGTEGRFADRSIHTSFLQRLRPTAKNFRALLPLYPLAVESFDLSGYDLVVSSSSAWAHGAIADPDALHICYCYNPFRYAWNAREEILSGYGRATRIPLRYIFNRWRQWDVAAASRIDRYVAISRTTQSRIGRYFGREADLLYPPVEIERFGPGKVEDYYLVLSELMPHKRIDIAVEAFSSLGLPLVVAGDGPEWRSLRRMAGKNVTFVGRVSDFEAANLLRGCKALVVTATEEFGIAAVEAQASGRPVIALEQGGVCETVVSGQTGFFYRPSSVEALTTAVEQFDPLAIDPQLCIESARRFDFSAFRSGLLKVVARSTESRGRAGAGVRRRSGYRRYRQAERLNRAA